MKWFFFRTMSVVLLVFGFASMMLSLMVWDNALGGWLTGKGYYLLQTFGLFVLALILFIFAGLMHKKANRHR